MPAEPGVQEESSGSPGRPALLLAAMAVAVSVAIAIAAGPLAPSPALAGDDAGDDPSQDAEEDAPPRATLGLAYNGPQEAPAGLGYARGASLYVYETTAGYAAGLRSNDVLVRIGDATLDLPPKEVLKRAKALIEALPLEAETALEVVREGKVVKVPVKPLRAPPRFDRVRTRGAWLKADPLKGAPAKAVQDLAKAAGAEARTADTLARLRAVEERRDPLRLRDEVEAHVRPFEAESIAREVAKDAADPLALLPHVRSTRGDAPRAQSGVVAEIAQAATLDDAAARIGAALAVAKAEVEKAFRRLSPEERKHLEESLAKDLGSRLAFTVMIDMDSDPKREERNRRSLEILKKVDMRPMGDALAIALATVDPVVLKRLAGLADAHPKRAEALILAKDTPGGRIEFAGAGDDVHAGEVAYRFDLGGADRWLDTGGAASPALPVAVAVDWDGDDLYSATSPGRQGAGILGVGVLVDRAGSDRYVGTRWSQGAGVAGAGVLVDQAGDDSYQLCELGQGLGLRGLGWLRDAAGADRYAASRCAQGLGLPGGAGVLRDEAGDDRYACGGRDLSNYGSPGVFEGWGQGLGLGFRGVASGGIGLLHDLGGRDSYDGGNFAQGGGYFFGFGILLEEGGDDRYLGARYAQGYACHEGVGVLVERAGNDRYGTLDAAAVGIAWDESTAVFHDEAGDDQYLVSGFSLGAADHNGVALCLDDKGGDVYQQTPARAGGNEYHGGASIALFLDGAGKGDRFLDGAGAPERAGWRGEDAFFLDAPAGSAAALARKGNVLEGK